MKKTVWWIAMCMVMVAAGTALANTWYVATNSASDGPGTAWSNAFHTIQGGVDAASSNDTVLVSNGVYDTGATVTPDFLLNNRICITNVITLRSVNGPSQTVITGNGPNGGGAVRCAYVSADAFITGFTFTNGHTQITSGNIFSDRSGGAVYLISGGIISNCIISGNAAQSYGGGILCNNGGIIKNCVFRYNSANEGGGATCYSGGTIEDCVFRANSANEGGGVAIFNSGTIRRCEVCGNTAVYNGGGVYDYFDGTIENSTISGNRAPDGGGLYCYNSGMVVKHSMLNCNSATNHGGGVYANGGDLQNCLISGNSAVQGGGMYADNGGSLENCTVVANSAHEGGGLYGNNGSAMQNTIVYFNAASISGGNWYTNGIGMYWRYCCITPTNNLPTGSIGCMDGNPRFSDNEYHLYSNSPCIDAGTALPGITNDFESVPRPIDGDGNGSAIMDIGACEYARDDVDTDGDGLSDWVEINRYGTDITRSDTDGDGISDDYEIERGFNPLVDSAAGLAGKGLYTSNSIMDLSMGYIMIQATGGTVRLNLQLEQCTNLVEGVWTNAGDAVEWERLAPDGKAFYRVRGGE